MLKPTNRNSPGEHDKGTRQYARWKHTTIATTDTCPCPDCASGTCPGTGTAFSARGVGGVGAGSTDCCFADASPPPPWHGIYFVDASATWAQAKTACETDGGRLALLDTAAKDAEAKSIKPSDKAGWFGADDPEGDGFRWLGGAPVAAEGASTASNFEDWKAGEPDNPGSQNCAIMTINPEFWRSWNCASRYGYFCEGVAPPPSAPPPPSHPADAANAYVVASSATGHPCRFTSGGTHELGHTPGTIGSGGMLVPVDAADPAGFCSHLCTTNAPNHGSRGACKNWYLDTFKQRRDSDSVITQSVPTCYFSNAAAAAESPVDNTQVALVLS